MQPYEILPSPSELRLRVRGADLKQLFRHALLGMFDSLEPKFVDGADPNTRVDFTQLHHVELNAPDTDVLLVDFLSEALYLSSLYRQVFTNVLFEHFDNQHISCSLTGKPFLALQADEIKAVTHHDVHIHEVDGGLETDIVFDI